MQVEEGEHFPADLLLVKSSRPDGQCYIETAELDGETNLKVLSRTKEKKTSVVLLSFLRCCRLVLLKMIKYVSILSRQARDKHR